MDPRKSNLDIQTDPVAFQKSVDDIATFLKGKVAATNIVSYSTSDEFLNKLIPIANEYKKTFALSDQLTSKYLEFNKEKDTNKKLDLTTGIATTFGAFNNQLKSQKQMGLLGVPDLTDEIKNKLPNDVLPQIQRIHQLLVIQRDHLKKMIPIQQSTYTAITNQVKDYNVRLKAQSNGAVAPAPSANPNPHQPPLSSSYGSQQQASARAAANANRAPASSAEEKQQQKR
jgi:hypothetical protein